jgi:hypothetical protein
MITKQRTSKCKLKDSSITANSVIGSRPTISILCTCTTRYHALGEAPTYKRRNQSTLQTRNEILHKHINSITHKAKDNIKTQERLQFLVNNYEKELNSVPKHINGAILQLKVDARIITDSDSNPAYSNKMMAQFRKDLKDARNESMHSIKDCVYKIQASPHLVKQLRRIILPIINNSRKPSISGASKVSHLQLRKVAEAKTNEEFKLVGLLQPRYYRAQKLEKMLFAA